MKVEIWSDVVCPWCYVGKRQFEEALSRFDHADQVEVEWRSFELDPDAPTRVGLPMSRVLERKYGMTPEQADAANRRMTEAGRRAWASSTTSTTSSAGNTFDAHRLIHLAARHGLGDAMEERLFAAYFTEGLAVGDRATLAGLAAEVGLDRDEVEPPCTASTSPTRCAGTRPGRPPSGSAGCPSSSSTRPTGSPGPSRPRCCSEHWSGPGRSRTRPPRRPRWRPWPTDRPVPTVPARSEPVAPAQVPEHPVGAGGRQGGHQAALVDHLAAELVPVRVLALGQPVHLHQLVDHRVVGGRRPPATGRTSPSSTT